MAYNTVVDFRPEESLDYPGISRISREITVVLTENYDLFLVQC